MIRFYSCDKGFIETEKKEGVCWVEATTPHADDIRYLTEEEGIPQIFFDYLEDLDERPRVEHEGRWIMTIIRIPVRTRSEKTTFNTVPIGIISNGQNHVITVCCHQNHLIDDFADHTRQKNICFDNVANFTLRIIYSTAFWFLDYLKRMTNGSSAIEKQLERSVQNDDLLRLMTIQKSLVYFNTAIKGDILVLERILKMYDNLLDHELYDDVEIELHQADSTVGIYTDILESTMGTYSSIISNNVNAVMKRMSGLSIILMVPTFVASLYGMNVDIMLTGKYAFWIIIGIAVVLTAIAFVVLRKLKWV